MDYVSKFGYNTKRKVDFGDFFMLAQKLLLANFKEVHFLQEKYDTERSGFFSIIPFVEELDSYRQGKGNQMPKMDALRGIISKCKSLNPQAMSDLSTYVCRNIRQITHDFSEKETKEVFAKIFDGKVEQKEIETLW